MTTKECATMLIPIEEVAEKLGTTPLNVLMRIKRGGLAGQEKDGAWYVTAESLARAESGEPEPAVSTVCSSHCGNCRSGG